MISCSEDNRDIMHDGNLFIEPSYIGEVQVTEVKSRAGEDTEEKVYTYTDESLKNSTILWISNGEGVIRKFNGLSTFPTGGERLVGGIYLAEAWAGDSVSASWTARYYKADQQFYVDGDVNLNLEMTLANVFASVVYDESIDDVLKDYKLTISHSRGSRTFEGKDTRVASFMMPTNRDADPDDNPKEEVLKWKLSAREISGDEFVKEGTIDYVSPGHQYILTFSHDGGTPDVGGAFIGLDIKDLDLIEHTNYIVQPPTIQRPGGTSITTPILVSKGNQLDNVYVEIGAVGIFSVVEISGEIISNILGESGERLNFMSASEDQIKRLELGGIVANGYNDGSFYNEVTNLSSMRITFAPELINSLENGTHEINFVVTDTDKVDDSDRPVTRTSRGTLTLIVSEDIVIVNIDDIDDYCLPENRNVTPNSVRLTGLVMDETVEISNVGIQYRVDGDDSLNWNFIPAITSSRSSGSYEFFIDKLQPATTYQYRTAWTKNGKESYSSVKKITTAVNIIPNGDFEAWGKSGNAVLIYDASSPIYWDSGNHGSSLLSSSSNVTVSCENPKHGGNYSACLTTRTVMGKMAAGNAFVGKYLATKGTNGVLGWGRPFYYKPKALKGWVKYNPATVGSKYTDSNVPDIVAGQPDKGIIYVALLTNDTDVQGDKDYPGWPVVVRTADTHLFKKDASNVIAYGELVFHEATAGNGMVEFTIPLDYYESMKDEDVYYLVLVCSASKGGDYFAGGDGSVMYIDDFEFVY